VADARVSNGCLFVVSTPIGNLGDITRRAVEVLGAVSLVVAEDTRRTRALLSHLGIQSQQVRALNAHSSADAVSAIVERLLSGDEVAIVTDAGTPAVSDPGRALVAAAAERGIDVRVVPGPSAVKAAVGLSALVEGPFSFLGFLPRHGTARRETLEELVESRHPVIFFESPQRMAATLRELAELMPERPVFVGRELTKLHEEGLRGSLRELAAREVEWRGEIVAVIGPNQAPEEPDADRRQLVYASLRAAVECGANPSRVARALAEASGLPRRELYEHAVELREAMGGEPGDAESEEG
jgi:16S rRNA (cytidine1402-2'-O)-methyltransferase